MIDKLFSDELNKKIKPLKNQKDGKIVDHIFEYESLLNKEDSVFYIGDSKYYKIGSSIEQKSVYKQFTYAKNVIQFNIDLLNNNEKINDKLRYRDNLTEGYNISPNFFIQGRIYNNLDFDESKLELDNKNKEPKISFHFEDRLFDRDTLFVHNYNINFLYVLKAYIQFNSITIDDFRESSKIKFKKSLTDYINDKYTFYKKTFDNKVDIEKYVNNNFKQFNGRIYRIENKPLEIIFAKIKTNQKDRRIFDGLSEFII
jgi:hypothetical protein